MREEVTLWWSIALIRDVVLDHLCLTDVIKLLHTSAAIRQLCEAYVPTILKGKVVRNKRLAMVDDSEGIESLLVAAGELHLREKGSVLTDYIPRPHDFSQDKPFEVGEQLDIVDTVYLWYDTTVVDTKIENGTERFKIHYHHWSNKWDEWITPSESPDRMAPLGTRVCGVRGDKSWSKHRDNNTFLVWYPPEVFAGKVPDNAMLRPLMAEALALLLPDLPVGILDINWSLHGPFIHLYQAFESRLVSPYVLADHYTVVGNSGTFISRVVHYTEMCDGEEVQLSHRFLVQWCKNMLVIVRRIGPRGCLGYPTQHLWNRCSGGAWDYDAAVPERHMPYD